MEIFAHRRCQRVAHRGGAALAPENTLGAFRQALRWPVDAIELDVQMSRDGHPIVFHDQAVERLTQGRGHILDLDLQELQELDAAAHFPGGWPHREPIPLLRDVLELVRPTNLQVHIEIKLAERDGVPVQYPGIAEAVAREVCAAGMQDRVLVISFDWAALPRIKSLAPGTQTGALVTGRLWDSRAADALATLEERISPWQCEWIGMDARLFTPAMVDVCHARGWRLGIWTVNTLADLQRLAQAGVDALTSDRPDLFCALPEELLWRA